MDGILIVSVHNFFATPIGKIKYPLFKLNYIFGVREYLFFTKSEITFDEG